jgi:uncharacterized membrane protein YkvA (DUF1232 family)
MRYLTKFQWFTLTLAALYIVMPVDFIPELLTGPFGLVDDAAAFAAMARRTTFELIRNQAASFDGASL